MPSIFRSTPQTRRISPLPDMRRLRTGQACSYLTELAQSIDTSSPDTETL